MKLAVLITVHNRITETVRCLESLYNMAELDKDTEISVYLVDDGSSDGTSKKLTKLYEDIIILSGSGNLYWCRGMKKAWEFATIDGDYDAYLWLNNDVILNNNALTVLSEGLNRSNFNSILVGTTVNLAGKITYGGRIEGRLVFDKNNWLECDYANGNVLVIPANVYERIGGLDSFFHHGLGDFEYTMRAKKRGFKLYVINYIFGNCEENFQKELSLIDSYKAMNTPLVSGPVEMFYFLYKTQGILCGIRVFFTTLIRPLWEKIKA